MSEQYLDEAIPGGVGTSSDTHFAESEIKKQSKVVRAHDLQEQSIIIRPDADTIVSFCKEYSLPDPEQNESSMEGSRKESRTVREGHSQSRATVDR